MKFLNDNINGLLQNVDNSHRIQYITSHVFVCLTESFVATSLESDLYNDYCMYTATAKTKQKNNNYVTFTESGGPLSTCMSVTAHTRR